MVSSYLPSLSSLAQSRKEFRSLPPALATGLVIHASAPGRGFARLPHVTQEVRLVSECFKSGGLRIACDTNSASATVSDTLEALRHDDVTIAHFACHGIQKENALQSAFVMSDGDLAIEDLMKLDLNLKNPCLAFLSACETAKSDPKQPDQAVHLAASMLFCGFRSVIATMW
jgi:CHAT domain-containing protein